MKSATLHIRSMILSNHRHVCRNFLNWKITSASKFVHCLTWSLLKQMNSFIWDYDLKVLISTVGWPSPRQWRGLPSLECLCCTATTSKGHVDRSFWWLWRKSLKIFLFRKIWRFDILSASLSKELFPFIFFSFLMLYRSGFFPCFSSSRFCH